MIVREAFSEFLESKWMKGLQAILAVLSLMAMAWAMNQSALAVEKVEKYAKCQAQYNEADQARTEALASANMITNAAEQNADEAQFRVFTHPAVLKPVNQRTTREKDELISLAVKWQTAMSLQSQARAKLAREQKANPVPPPPSDRCGDLD